MLTNSIKKLGRNDILYFSVGSEGCSSDDPFEIIPTTPFTPDIKNKLEFSVNSVDENFLLSPKFKKVEILSIDSNDINNSVTYNIKLVIEDYECRDKIINEFAIYVYNTTLKERQLACRFNKYSEIMNNKKRYEITEAISFRLV